MFSHDELLKLVKKIKEGSYFSEREADADIETLNENVLAPFAIDYIFQKEYDDLSPEEIVDKIMEYKPIRL